MSTTFADLGVSNSVASALAKRGIETPFPVQKMVVEDVLAGRDVLVQSPTGSGKTLAFGIPLVERIAADARRPAALVLAPTRELARQIVDELDAIARARALKVEVVYGGVGMEPQIRKAPKAHILVATPGRLEDLLQRRALTLKHVGMLVLDEADRMLDMGFKPAVDRIVQQTSRERQTLFFSATLDGAPGDLAASYTRDAKRHVNAPKREKAVNIAHRFARVDSQAEKVDALVEALDARDVGRTLVFVRTKRGADRLIKKLKARDVVAVAMHGDKSQNQRQKALAKFEKGDVTVLVATDVAARGIDVPEVTDVVNFDAPEDGDTYTHRVGRTGRAGASGRCISFILDDQTGEMAAMARGLKLSKQFDAAFPGGAHKQAGRNGGGGSGRGARKGGRHSGRAHSQGKPKSGGHNNGNGRKGGRKGPKGPGKPGNRSNGNSSGSGGGSRVIASAGGRRHR